MQLRFVKSSANSLCISADSIVAHENLSLLFLLLFQLGIFCLSLIDSVVDIRFASLQTGGRLLVL